MNKVQVNADPSGSVVVAGNNPEYGYIRLSQLRMVVDEKGWVEPKLVTALLLGTTSNLRAFNYKAGQELEGRIAVKEQFVPFNKKNPEKDLKIAGDTKITCVVGEKPIYRKAFYSMDANEQDVLIAHTNKEQIKAVFDSLKKEVVKEAL